MSDIIKTVQEALADRTTIRSLALLLGAATAAALGALRALEWALTSTGLVAGPLDDATRALIVVLVLFVSWVGAAILWVSWRAIPTIRGSRAAILIAASADQEVQALVCRLQEALVVQVAEHGLRGLVRTYVLPRNRVVNNIEDARRALDLAGARLIVWGTVASGTIAGHVVSGFKNIHFTMRHRFLDPSQLAGVRSALAPALFGRQWLFSEGETFFGLDMVAGNVTEVAIFALALALAVDGDLIGAARLLGPLRQTAQAIPPPQRRTEGFLRFSEAVRELLLNVRHLQHLDLYQRELVDRITDRAADDVAHRCLALADECASLSTVPCSYDLAKAIIAFHFGRIEEAAALVESACQSLPSDPSPLLSRAFLALWKGELSRVPQLYRKAERRGPLGVEVLFQVVRFLQAVHDRCPERHELLFALAVINQHLDSGLARHDFETFLAATSAREDLEVLRAEAKRRLAALA